MAKTWIDHQVTRLVDVVASDMKLANALALQLTNEGTSPNIQTALHFFKKGPFLERVKVLSAIRTKNLFDVIEGLPSGTNPPAEEMVEVFVMGWISSVLGASTMEIFNQADCTKKAIQPSRDLIERLSGLRPPKVEENDTSVFEGHIWYFDFPHGVYPQKHSISEDGKGNPINVEVFCRSVIWHSQQQTLCIVLETQKQPIYIYLYNDDGKMGVFYSKIIQTEESAITIANRIIDMVMLLILYYQSHREDKGDTVKPLSFANLNSPKVLKSQKPVKGISLFKMDQLNAREGSSLPSMGVRQQFGNDPYSHSFKVNGHFRWQPHGVKRTRRKLIWIDGFIKGQGEFQPRDTIIKLG